MINKDLWGRLEAMNFGMYKIIKILERSISELSKHKKEDKRRKQPFHLSKAIKLTVQNIEEPSISMLVCKLNEKIDHTAMRKLKATEITLWLSSSGYLKKIETENNSYFMEVTQKGECLGISRISRKAKNGNTYNVNIYNSNAQKFIIDNLEEITSNSCTT